MNIVIEAAAAETAHLSKTVERKIKIVVSNN